eukprot:TRINITY_DN4285_c0_g2_i1.p1 TRINITY_DN4285_c0_g2~~TRINITY_DN4285_c0_g2_i1.p1  ORF type:complete len:647 (+),score=148.48 TRINITY_DN4285_c0_g2_i1:134-2074(+)
MVAVTGKKGVLQEAWQEASAAPAGTKTAERAARWAEKGPTVPPEGRRTEDDDDEEEDEEEEEEEEEQQEGDADAAEEGADGFLVGDADAPMEDWLLADSGEVRSQKKKPSNPLLSKKQQKAAAAWFGTGCTPGTRRGPPAGRLLDYMLDGKPAVGMTFPPQSDRVQLELLKYLEECKATPGPRKKKGRNRNSRPLARPASQPAPDLSRPPCSGAAANFAAAAWEDDVVLRSGRSIKLLPAREGSASGSQPTTPAGARKPKSVPSLPAAQVAALRAGSASPGRAKQRAASAPKTAQARPAAAMCLHDDDDERLDERRINGQCEDLKRAASGVRQELAHVPGETMVELIGLHNSSIRRKFPALGPEPFAASQALRQLQRKLAPHRPPQRRDRQTLQLPSRGGTKDITLDPGVLGALRNLTNSRLSGTTGSNEASFLDEGRSGDTGMASPGATDSRATGHLAVPASVTGASPTPQTGSGGHATPASRPLTPAGEKSRAASRAASRPASPRPQQLKTTTSFMDLQNESCFDLQGARSRSCSRQGRAKPHEKHAGRKADASGRHLKTLSNRAITTTNPGTLQRMAEKTKIAMSTPTLGARSLGCNNQSTSAGEPPADVSLDGMVSLSENSGWIPAPGYRRIAGLSWEDWKT